MAAKGLISYWYLPIFSGLVWLSMLLGMLLYWIVGTDAKRYSNIDNDMFLAYISDIGAHEMQPLFITGCVLTTVFFDLSFAAERWLRHRGRLAPNISMGEKVLMGLTIAFAIVGTVGLICLSIFDNVNYPKEHDLFLFLFMGGYLVSAIFICWEYQRLGAKYRRHRHLRVSFWVKLTFVLVELAFTVAFGVLTFTDNKRIAAVFEWVIAFIFTFYILSFVLDLAPAAKTKAPEARFEKPNVSDLSDSSDQNLVHR